MLLLLIAHIIVGIAIGRIFTAFALVVATLVSIASSVVVGSADQIRIGWLLADIVGLTATLQGAYLLGLFSTRWTHMASWPAYTHHHRKSA